MNSNRRQTAGIPADKLTITMWDFSWYTMTLPGEPYHDLAARFREARERGYNTIRICAMPYLLFAETGPRPGPLKLGSLGEAGQRTRWYNCRGGAELDGHAHLLELFRQAKTHDCFIILSSWEYQQSPSFLAEPDLQRELAAIPSDKRCMTLARSLSRLIAYVDEAGFADRIAYAELHNEVEYGRLAEIGMQQGIDASDTAGLIEAMRPDLEEALAYLREQRPDIPFTVCYTLNDPYPKTAVARNVQVAHYHLYVKEMIEELVNEAGVYETDAPFPNAFARSLLREGAPPFERWTLPEDQRWRMEGNPVGMRMIYLHDWADPDKWDFELYDRFGVHKRAMLQKIDERFAELAAWAKKAGIPVVIGEGYVGYTPLHANFEEGPVGKFIAEYAIRKGMSLGFKGMTLCSNCAPHHPFWNDIEWQRKWNRFILESSVSNGSR